MNGNRKFEEMNQKKEEKLKPSIEDPPKLELKKLLEHLAYSFLGENLQLLVIIASNLEENQRKKHLMVLRVARGLRLGRYQT